MTDNEIIKALECCERNKDDCTECPHMISCFKGKDTPFFLPELLNVFIRQKVEIERLNNCCVGLQNERDAYKDIVNEAVDETKSEAIKKFAEMMKPNCRRCYYGGGFIKNKGLATCDSTRITEPTIIEYDNLLKKNTQYVKRTNWDDECKCECFIPLLSESEKDFELEEVLTFETSFGCPFCGEDIDVYDIGVDETKLITCYNCERKIAISGKEI